MLLLPPVICLALAFAIAKNVGVSICAGVLVAIDHVIKTDMVMRNNNGTFTKPLQNLQQPKGHQSIRKLGFKFAAFNIPAECLPACRILMAVTKPQCQCPGKCCPYPSQRAISYRFSGIHISCDM
jgi:hypothetical protein